MGVGRVPLLSKGPMRGQYVFLTAKYVLFIDIFYFSYYFRRLSLLFPSNDYAISLVGTLAQIRMGIDRMSFYSQGPTRD